MDEAPKINILAVTIDVPAKAPVIVDKRSGVKSMMVPFTFADGVEGALTITRVVRVLGQVITKQPDWHPEANIESITIKFKE